MTDRRIGIFVVDDRGLARSTMGAAFDHVDTIEVLGEAPTSSAVSRIRAVQPDIAVIIDHRNQVSADVCRELSTTRTAQHCMFVLTDPTRTSLHDAIAAGATGVLSSESSFTELIDALHWLHERGSYVDQRLSALMIRPPERPDDERRLLARLSDSERAVLDLLVQGHTNREIGEHLHLSDLTVRNKVSIILRKLEVSSRVEAAVLAVETKYQTAAS